MSKTAAESLHMDRVASVGCVELQVSGKAILVDADMATHVKDACLWVTGHGYVRGYFHRRTEEFYLHRLVMNPSDGMVVDHINGNPLDNRRANLRVCTQAENVRNSRHRSDNTSGTPGVFYSKERKKWAAQINVNGRMRPLGRFLNKEDAIAARIQAEFSLHGSHSRHLGVLLND